MKQDHNFMQLKKIRQYQVIIDTCQSIVTFYDTTMQTMQVDKDFCFTYIKKVRKLGYIDDICKEQLLIRNEIIVLNRKHYYNHYKFNVNIRGEDTVARFYKKF